MGGDCSEWRSYGAVINFFLVVRFAVIFNKATSLIARLSNSPSVYGVLMPVRPHPASKQAWEPHDGLSEELYSYSTIP